MNNEPSYQMTVRGIKKIMQGEIESKFNYPVRLQLGDDLYFLSRNLIISRLERCITYDELETFCKLAYRMSLSEWIESL